MSGRRSLSTWSSLHSVWSRFVVMLLALAVVGFWQQHVRAADDSSTRVRAVILKDMMPVSYVDPATGQPAGFGVDVFNAIAAKAGLTVEYQAVGDWKDIDETLKGGRADVCPMLTMNEARKEFVTFTEPYHIFGLTIIIRDNTTGIKGLADLDSRRVAVIRKSQAYEFLKDRPGIHLVEYDTFYGALFDLLAGKVDAYVGPNDIFTFLARQAGVEDKIRALSPPLKEFKRAIAFSKSDSRFHAQLSPLVATFESSAEFQKLYMKWFGKPQPFWTAGRVAVAASAILLASISLMAFFRYRAILKLNSKLQQSIAEREQAEAFLRESREKEALILETATEAIYGVDLEGRCTFANSSCVRLLGYQSSSDLLGRNMHHLIHHTHADGSAYEEAECPILMAVHDGARRHWEDELFWRADGTSFAAESWSSPMVHDGVLVGAVVTFLDVTERKALKKALEKNEEYLRSLVNYAGDAIYVCDDTGRLIDCNMRACEILGYSRDELLRMTVNDIDVHMSDDKNVQLWEDLEPGRVVTVESFHRRRDGTIYPVEIRIGLLGSGNPRLILGLARDITLRRKSEEEVRQLNAQLEQRIEERTAELQASNRELESFCYSVSHDLRAPLRAMSSFCSILSEDYAEKLDQQGKDYLTRISEGAQRMGHLIDALLQLGRVGRAELSIEEFDLTAMAREVAAQLADAQGDRQVNVVVADGLKANGDRLLLRLVLQNLLDNARKFTAKMSEGALIEFGSTSRQGDTVYFVRDNGAGFEMAYADKLFAPFQRLHNDDSFKGAGVGLATVQRILDRHGGTIWAESEPDRGSTFYFTL